MAIEILTINEIKSDNLGDQAIARSFNAVLKSKGIIISNADYSCRANVINEGKLKVVKKRSTNILKYTKPLRYIKWIINNHTYIRNKSKNSSDIILIGGGQLILSNSHFAIALFLWCLYLSFYNKKIYIMGVGCGEKFSLLDTYLIKIALRKAKKIYVRDVDSSEKIESIFDIESNVIPDIAYFLYENKNENKKNTCVVGIVDFNVFQRYQKEMENKSINSLEDYYNNWINKINNIHCDNVILASTTESDVKESNEFFKYAKGKIPNKNISIHDTLQSLDDYIDLLKQSKYVLSGRMHSLILGECFHCIIYPWDISQKIVSYRKENINNNALDKSRALSLVIDEILKNENITV